MSVRQADAATFNLHDAAARQVQPQIGVAGYCRDRRDAFQLVQNALAINVPDVQDERHAIEHFGDTGGQALEPLWHMCVGNDADESRHSSFPRLG